MNNNSVVLGQQTGAGGLNSVGGQQGGLHHSSQRDMYAHHHHHHQMATNGYMPNGYSMMHDPNYGQHYMAAAAAGLYGPRYDMNQAGGGSTGGGSASPMSSYMNGANYGAMYAGGGAGSPYSMQSSQMGSGGQAGVGSVGSTGSSHSPNSNKSETPTPQQQQVSIKREYQQQPSAGGVVGNAADLRHMISMYLPGDASSVMDPTCGGRLQPIPGLQGHPGYRHSVSPDSMLAAAAAAGMTIAHM